MPHAAFAGISVPAAVIATMRHPVAFDAPDDGDVYLLDVGGFILTLSQSSRLLRQPGFRDCLRKATSSAEAHAGSKPLRRGVAGLFAAPLPWAGDLRQ